MSDLVRHLQDVARYGMTATVTAITGTACPCMVSRDSSRPSYSAQWHRDNTGAAACNGTGIISAVTTTTTITAFFESVAALTNSIQMQMMEKLLPIGEIDGKDLMMYSPVKSDGTAYDLETMVERKDKITYDGKQYLVRHVFDLAAGMNIGQWALLKRIA